jgi:acetyl esterase/lipase
MAMGARTKVTASRRFSREYVIAHTIRQRGVIVPSIASEALREQYESLTARMAANPGMDIVSLRSMLEEINERAAEPADVTYQETEIAGRRALWINPLGASENQVILFLHGGGFVAGSINCHRKLAGHLAKAAGMRALIPAYRLAPEHPFPAQLEDSVTAFRWLLDQGVRPGDIATAGDSAGGNLATSVCLKLRDEGLALPTAIVSLSPWYDMEAAGSTLDSNAAVDALGRRELYQNLAEQVLGRHSRTDPLANPLYADLTDLPPIYLTCGTQEVLQDNAERFAQLARDHDVDVTLEVGEGMQHVYEFMAGRAPEADHTIANIGHWLRSKVGQD